MQNFVKSNFVYLYCMLRRNNEEMHFQPHLGHYLAKHLYVVDTENQLNDVISCGSVITKIAQNLLLQSLDKPVDG